jgi:hypothetical protein
MFKVSKYLGGKGAYPDVVEIPVASGAAFEAGQALTVSGGVAAVADGDVAVAFVSCTKLTAEESALGKKLGCYKVTPDIIFEGELSAYSSTVALGAALTLAGGEKVTATAASKGGAKIIDTCGAAAAGDTVLVTFA